MGTSGRVRAAVLRAAESAPFLGRRVREIRKVPPALRTPALFLPVTVTHRVTLSLLRRGMPRRRDVPPEVTTDERLVPGTGHDVRVLTYASTERRTPGGVLLWLHGGGRVLGGAEMDDALCTQLALEAGVLVVSVDYRLAPEHPFPAALDDAFAVLQWIHRDAHALGVDPARVAVGGASAGGGLAAELSQRAVDEEVAVAFQLLQYPMLDDRTVTVDDAGRGRLSWSPASNRFCWSSYLGHAAGGDERRPYAVAARREDLSGLPPAWIGVGDLDLFHDEDVAYAHRLRAADVACELDVEPGMYHGADVLPRRLPAPMLGFRRRMADALRRALTST